MIVLFYDRESGQYEGLPCAQIDVNLGAGLIVVWDRDGDFVVLDKDRGHFFAIRKQEDLQHDEGHGEV